MRMYVIPSFPGLVYRAFRGFARNFFHATAELFEDLGAAAYLEFALRAEGTEPYDGPPSGVGGSRHACGAHVGDVMHGPCAAHGPFAPHEHPSALRQAAPPASGAPHEQGGCPLRGGAAPAGADVRCRGRIAAQAPLGANAAHHDVVGAQVPCGQPRCGQCPHTGPRS